MNWETEFRNSLLNYYEVLKKRNHRLSIRALAKKLDVSPGTMSEIMRGSKRWKLTAERALRILEKMEVSPRERNYLKVLLGQAPTGEVRSLAVADHATLSDWAYGPVLVSFDISNEHWTMDERARRFGLTVERFDQIVADLVARGLLERMPNGQLRRVEGFWEPSPDMPVDVVQKFRESSLEVTKKALREIPAAEQDFMTLTFAGSRKKMELLRHELKQFCEKTIALMGSDDRDEVFRLNIALFPFDFTNAKKTEPPNT